MNSAKKNKNGCLWIFVFGIISLFGWIFMSVVFDFNSYISAFAPMILAVFLTTRWIGRPSFKSLVINAVLIVIIVAGLRFVSTFLRENVSITGEDTSFTKEEGVALSTIVEDMDTIPVYRSHRIWKDNYGNRYNSDLIVRDADYQRLKNRHSQWKFKESDGHFWGSLYDHLEQTNTPSLDLVLDAFLKIQKAKKLNQMEFAEMVVSCIQDIPYSFIFQDECLPIENYESSIQRVLRDCPECCLGNVAYGIQNPVSFLQNLKGDCDTRTVLIYAVLKHFNYDVAILNSEFYRHSILGINLAAPGLYKRHYGKKYVVWETTAKYFEIGRLPENFKDITHWNVILTSK